ncbi:hypothetical protein D3C78_1678530 [compost metagenome]
MPSLQSIQQRVHGAFVQFHLNLRIFVKKALHGCGYQSGRGGGRGAQGDSLIAALLERYEAVLGAGDLAEDALHVTQHQGG